MERIFLDTNIVIDLLGERMPFYDAVAKIATLADKKKLKLFVSPVSLATAHYILSKYESNKAATLKIRKFKVLSEIALVNETVVDKALNSSFKDFEDALQYFAALEAKCDALLTRNEKDFKNASIPVMNGENYLRVKYG